MRKLLAVASLLITGAIAFAQDDEPAHLHGPDGRHIIAPTAGGGPSSSILSHHDMRIEDSDGNSIEGCNVFSFIVRAEDESDAVHTEQNVYEPDIEVYGSHMSYTEPGEYVLIQDVTLPDGETFEARFPVFVFAEGGEAEQAEASSSLPLPLIVGGSAGVAMLLVLAYFAGRRRGQIAAGVLPLIVLVSAASVALAQQGAMYYAYPTEDKAEKVVQSEGGVTLRLSIENEMMTSDPDLVTLSEDAVGKLGLELTEISNEMSGGRLEVFGHVSASASGEVLVNSNSSGRIVELPVEPGALVLAGRVLAVLESGELATAQSDYATAQANLRQHEHALDIARADLASAQEQERTSKEALERQRLLADSGAFDSTEVEEARRGVLSRRAELQTAQTSLAADEEILSRLERGLQSGVVSQNEVARARTLVQQGKNRISEAQDQLAISEQTLAREESIRQQGLRKSQQVASSERDYELARSATKSAQSAVARADAQVDLAQSSIDTAVRTIRFLGGSPGSGHRILVRAPIAGTLTNRSVSLGETVEPGETICTLLNTKTVWVNCEVFERDLPQVETGQEVQIFAEGVPAESFNGVIQYIDPVVDEQKRTVHVRVVVENESGVLKPNMYVRAAIGTGTADYLMVPRSALLSDLGRDVLFVQVSDLVFRRVPVTIRASLGPVVGVEGELEVGQSVVVQGGYQLLLDLRGN